MDNISKLSPLEVAVLLLKEAKAPKNINELLDEVIEAKGIDKDDNQARAKLYSDIISSSQFVFLGENELWDLKLNHPLEEFDRDGASFTPKDEIYDGEEELDLEDNEDEEEEDRDEDEDDERDDEEDEDEVDREDEVDEEEYDESYEDDDTVDDDEFEEDKYNEIMDDYEDMYD